jgi:hypothetical protein
MGYQPSLAYNIALCHYRMKQYTQARKNIIEIIEKAIREHPELGVGSGTHSPDEDLDVHSVGNSQTLQETAIIEAENLKAAIEFEMKNSMGEIPQIIICLIDFLQWILRRSLYKKCPRAQNLSWIQLLCTICMFSQYSLSL